MYCRVRKMVSEIKITMFILLIIVFSNTVMLNASTFDIPKAAASIYVADTTHDGKLEIIIGHNHNFDTEWSGISIYDDTGLSEYSLQDSLFLYAGQSSIYALDVTKNGFPDIIARNYESEIPFIAVLENDGIAFTRKYYQMDYGVSDFTTGDIDGDGDIDIVFYSNNGYFWGYMRNNGTGQFGSPIYRYFEVPLGSIACGDLNNDGVDEVVVSCSPDKLLIYSSGLLIDEVTYSTDYSEIWVRDINSDGKNEIIVAGGVIGAYTELLVFSKNDTESFELSYSKRINEAMTRLFIADLNGDDFPDIVYNCSYYYPNSDYEKWHTYIMYNENGVTFADAVNFQTYFGDTPSYTSTIRSLVADIDGNGLKDIVALNSSYAYENDVTILFQTEEGDFVQEPQTGIENQDNLVSKAELYQNYPNPFNNETKIQFSLDSSSEVELSVYNGKGELVESLVQGRYERGNHSVNYRTDGLTSGVYYYELKVNGIHRQDRKMLYLR
jgi:hypothetical protein